MTCGARRVLRTLRRDDRRCQPCETRRPRPDWSMRWLDGAPQDAKCSEAWVRVGEAIDSHGRQPATTGSAGTVERAGSRCGEADAPKLVPMAPRSAGI
jgi:hypothetical protein